MISFHLLGGIVLVLVVSLPAWADEHCLPIALANGATTLSIDDEVMRDDVRCYRLTAAMEQRVAIEVLSGHNLVFSIQGQDEAPGLAFEVPRQQVFTIVIGQLIANVDAQTYRLTIRLEP